ncbi:hypothetical protein CXG81DRAFT_4662, partial [Caulochytrium protostelioides]
SLPRLRVKRAHQANPLHAALLDAVHTTITEREAAQLLDHTALDQFWEALCQHAVASGPGAAENDKRLSWDAVCHVRADLPARFAPYLTPAIFLHFQRSERSDISLLQYFNYVLRRASLEEAQAELHAYDRDYDGCLTEAEVQEWISDLVPTLHLQTLNTSFHKFYFYAAARKFFFFLDKSRRDRLPIQAILLSPILTELFELRASDADADAELPREYKRSNWFSSYNTLRVYGQFLNLDADHNGMLSRAELGKYSHGALSNLFLDRLFQEVRTFDRQMDFRGFLDFVLAVENLPTPEAMAYCFRALDMGGRGGLDALTLETLFRAVSEKAHRVFGHEEVPAEDIVNEIFDMVKPATPGVIRLKDLIDSGIGGTVISILIDCRGFHKYDNRD